MPDLSSWRNKAQLTLTPEVHLWHIYTSGNSFRLPESIRRCKMMRQRLFRAFPLLKLSEQYLAGKDQAACYSCRFEEEDDKPVLYVYEIQLEARCQGKGLGKFMMKMMELVAFQLGMSGIMLTALQENSAALNFYKSLGYTQHNSSPLVTLEHDPGYRILCKPIRKRRTL